jgi:hypothetical protein
MVNNALTSGTPNADGRNSVIGLTTISNVDDNLEYTVTNSTAGTAFTQDLGNTTAASLNATNSALFQVFTQDSSSRVSFLPATRFPFAWNSGTNLPQYITSTGTRTSVTSTNFFVYFVYATQNPVAGAPLKVISATSQFTNITNARAFNWVDIQNTYSIIGNDNEIRPLYRLIFETRSSGGGAYDVGAKYSVLRETQDLRKAAITSTLSATGSIPATSVTVVPAGNIASTNVQSALEELDAEKEPLKGADDNYVTDAQLVVIGNTSGTNTGDASGHTGLVPYTGASGAVDLGANGISANKVTLATGVYMEYNAGNASIDFIIV